MFCPGHNAIQTPPQLHQSVIRDPETTVSTVALSWNRSDKSSSLNSGQSAHALEQRFKKNYALRGLSILRFGQTETHGEDILCETAEIGRAQPLITLQQQTRADDQDRGKPHFQR